MPIAKKSETEIKKVNASNQLAQDALDTISQVKQSPAVVSESETVEDVSSKTEIDENSSSKAKYSDTVIARLTTGKRAEFKSFFSKYGVTMNSGIEMCIEYVMSQVDSGNAKISKAGVK